MKTRDVRSPGRVHTSCDRLQAQPFTPSPVGIAAALKRAVAKPVSAWTQEEPNLTVGVGLLTKARLKTLHPVPERSFVSELTPTGGHPRAVFRAWIRRGFIRKPADGLRVFSMAPCRPG